MTKTRRSMLFCPANNSKMLAKAHLKKPDCIIFDLEDAIAYSEKQKARKMLCEAIQTVNYGDCEVFARINALNTPFGETDVKELVKSGIRNIRLPMCESNNDIIELDEMLSYYEGKYEREIGEIKIQGAIETPKGVLNALDIATASPRMVAISFGAEDYTNCLGVDRTKKIEQLLYARSYIVVAANVANIDSIDTVFSDLKDMDGFIKETIDAKELGFSGKSCIHPLQVNEVHKIYSPTQKDIEKSLKIINEAKKVEKKGIGVITVDGKMVDKPIIKKAEKVIRLAQKSKLI